MPRHLPCMCSLPFSSPTPVSLFSIVSHPLFPRPAAICVRSEPHFHWNTSAVAAGILGFLRMGIVSRPARHLDSSFRQLCVTQRDTKNWSWRVGLLCSYTKVLSSTVVLIAVILMLHGFLPMWQRIHAPNYRGLIPGSISRLCFTAKCVQRGQIQFPIYFKLQMAV
jgi:hypothetical protein